MTPRFLNFIPFILKWETEFNKDGSVRVEHDPDDPGGTTKYGIDQRSHPHVDIAKLTKDDATGIYWSEWQEAGCDTRPPGLGEVYFNACVNCGTGRAQKLVALAKNDAAEFLRQQTDFYKRLVAERPRFQKYLRGWLNRVEALRKWLGISA